jgi:hypothetical protein
MKLSDEAVEWLADGEQGASSRAIFNRLALGRHVSPFDYPADIDDFQRCERLLRAVPELRDSFPLMAGVGPHWPPLIEAWAEVARLLDEDAPGLCDIGWRALDGLGVEGRRDATTRAAAVWNAAYDKGWEAYRATGDERSTRLGRMTVTRTER